MYVCRGCAIRASWPSSSFQCASQPDTRGMANKTVNMSIGKPMAW
jgi:hypothetical protein